MRKSAAPWYQRRETREAWTSNSPPPADPGKGRRKKRAFEPYSGSLRSGVGVRRAQARSCRGDVLPRPRWHSTRPSASSGSPPSARRATSSAATGTWPGSRRISTDRRPDPSFLGAHDERCATGPPHGPAQPKPRLHLAEHSLPELGPTPKNPLISPILPRHSVACCRTRTSVITSR